MLAALVRAFCEDGPSSGSFHMIVCTRCGASNQPTSKFCLSCGNPLAGAAAAPPPAYGAPPPAPAPQPAWGQPPAAAPPPYAPPPAAPPQYAAPPAAAPQYAPPPAAPWQPPPPAGPPPGYGAPPPAWNAPPPDPSGFAPAGSPDRARFGSPEGMNPFGATVGPSNAPQAAPAGGGAYGPPPQPQYEYAPPQYAPPPAAAPGPAIPAAVYGQQPPAVQWAPPTPPPPAPPAASGASGAHSHDPSAFAATSPPPTSDEHEAHIRRSQAPIGPSAPPPHASAAPAASSPPGRDPELVDASALRTLAGFLVSYDQNDFGVFWPIYQGQNVLGRKAASAGLDIEIDSPTTSSRHAIIYASARPGRLKLEDVGSTNGTFLNEAALERGKKFELRDNDTLRFGGFNVTVKIV